MRNLTSAHKEKDCMDITENARRNGSNFFRVYLMNNAQGYFHRFSSEEHSQHLEVFLDYLFDDLLKNAQKKPFAWIAEFDHSRFFLDCQDYSDFYNGPTNHLDGLSLVDDYGYEPWPVGVDFCLSIYLIGDIDIFDARERFSDQKENKSMNLDLTEFMRPYKHLFQDDD